MVQRLEGKVAVITGSGRGIGRAVATLMAEEGARVIINDLGGAADGTGADKVPADEVVAAIKKMGGEAVVNYDSVATAQGGENIIQTAIEHFGRIDILVNNAGILRDRMIFNMTEEEWDAVIKVHLYGHFYCTKPASVLMRQQRSGRIINISSQAGLATTMGQVNYAAAKEGIVGFTRMVAKDLGKYGITCNAIRPRAGTRLTLSPELRAAWERAGRWDTIKAVETQAPEDVAPFVVYLASDEAANINGRTFLVGGGLIGLYSEPVTERTIWKEDRWTLDELSIIVPSILTKDLVNPAPLQPEEKK